MHRAFIFFTVAVSSALARFVCPDVFGMFRHPQDCSIFYVCNYGMAHERSCPPNLHFDTDLGVCRHSSDVHCLHQTQLLTTGFTCSSPVGLFADPFSCEHFYLCANGHPYRQKCPFGLIFDGALCNWKYDRSCLFQDRLWLGEIRSDTNKTTQPTEPLRPSKIDIQKMPKLSTQRIQGNSVPYPTPDGIMVNLNDPPIEDSEEENERQANILTVTPLGRSSGHTELRRDTVFMLENEKDNILTKLQEAPEATTLNLEQNENVKLHPHKTQTPKVQNHWNELQRQQQQQQQHHQQQQHQQQQQQWRRQWMMQRQRPWRLQMRRRLQQQWRLHQEQRKLHERQRKLKKQQRANEPFKQQRANVNYSLNQTTISTRFMAGKVTAKTGFISRSPVGNEKISRKWWRLYWTERPPRSEKTTSPLLLFPIRHKIQSSATIAIQAFGFKNRVDNSRGISNNSISRHVGNPEKKDINNDYNGNSENPQNNTNNIAEINRITTDSNSINTNHSTSTDGNKIGKIKNNTRVINNATNNASSTNTNISIHHNNSTDNFNVTSNMDINSNKATNSNLATSYTMNNNNATRFNNSNSRDINNRNNSVLGQIHDNTTDAMFVFRTSQSPNKRSDF